MFWGGRFEVVEIWKTKSSNAKICQLSSSKQLVSLLVWSLNYDTRVLLGELSFCWVKISVLGGCILRVLVIFSSFASCWFPVFFCCLQDIVPMCWIGPAIIFVSSRNQPPTTTHQPFVRIRVMQLGSSPNPPGLNGESHDSTTAPPPLRRIQTWDSASWWGRVPLLSLSQCLYGWKSCLYCWNPKCCYLRPHSFWLNHAEHHVALDKSW